MWPLQCSNHADMHASGESHGATGDGCCCRLCGGFQATAGLLGIVRQPGKHTSSLYCPFSNSTPSCKMSLFLGDSLHTADLVGNFSLIKFGQPRLRELLQGPNVKTQWDIAQPMRTGHFSTLSAGSSLNCYGSAAKGAGYHWPSEFPPSPK